MGHIDIGSIIIQFVVFLFSLTLHEVGHAWTSEQFGDPTGRYEGRISLNPLVHIDPIGTVLLPLAGMIFGGFFFGWAKPVPVNPVMWRNKTLANIAVSAAGPLANLLILFVAVSIKKALIVSNMELGTFQEPVGLILEYAIWINLILAVFNMLPIPPLDGSHILSSILSIVNPSLMESYESIRPYGFFILIGLSYTGVLSIIMSPVILPIIYLINRFLQM